MRRSLLSVSLLCVIAVGLSLAITSALIAQEKEAETPPRVPPLVVPVAGSIPAAEQRILAELAEPTTLEFIETSLSDVILSLSNRHKIPIVLDVRTLDGVGIGTELEVTCSFKGVALRTSLELMLDYLELTWTIRDEVLLITTAEEAEANTKTRVYSVPDLMRGVRGPYNLSPKTLDGDLLLNAVRMVSDRDSSCGISIHAGNLVVSANDQTQLEVQALLNGLRMAKYKQPHIPLSFKEPIFLSTQYRGRGFDRVAKALKEPTSLEFIETALSDVILALQDRHEIPIVLDERSLGAVGIGSDTPISQSLKGISLESALNLMLKELELTWSIHGGVLVITTVESAEDSLPLAVHMVRDLIDRPGTSKHDYDSLIELITTTMHPDSWEEGTGPWQDCVPFEPADALLIRQSCKVQLEIHDLLTTLRQSPSNANWRPEQQAEEIHAEAKATVLQTFIVNHGRLHSDTQIETIRAVEFVEANLSKEALTYGKLRSSEDRLTLFMTPTEAAELQRAFLKAGLPVWNPRFDQPPRR